MKDSKEKCNALKSIRQNLANKLGIKLNQKECTFEGECTGTCPKCEQEEIALNKKLLEIANETLNLDKEYIEDFLNPASEYMGDLEYDHSDDFDSWVEIEENKQQEETGIKHNENASKELDNCFKIIEEELKGFDTNKIEGDIIEGGITEYNDYKRCACLIIIAGCAGSGKTTLGKRLAEQLECVHIDIDTIDKELTDSKNNLFNSEDINKVIQLEYNIMLKMCKEMLDCGINVILTIPLIEQIRDWSRWVELKKKANIGENVLTFFVWIKHDIEKEKRNIIKREDTRDKYRLEHWEDYAKSINGIEPAPEFNAYICDNENEVDISNILLIARKMGL